MIIYVIHVAGVYPLTTHTTDPSKLDVGTALVQCHEHNDYRGLFQVS